MGDNLKQVRYNLPIVATRASGKYMVLSYKSEITKRTLLIVRHVHQRGLVYYLGAKIYFTVDTFSLHSPGKYSSIFNH